MSDEEFLDRITEPSAPSSDQILKRRHQLAEVLKLPVEVIWPGNKIEYLMWITDLVKQDELLGALMTILMNEGIPEKSAWRLIRHQQVREWCLASPN
ncbi:hypothetical protein KQI84_01665 [bacterium]|nr:hypothetical protein [bacterium]